jgi:hypothetical protein
MAKRLSIPVGDDGNLNEIALLLRLCPEALEQVRAMMKVDTERGRHAIACLIVHRLNPAHDFTEEEEAAMRDMSTVTLRKKKAEKVPLPPLA